MSDDRGPWDREPADGAPPERSRPGLWVWLAVVAALAAGAGLLFRAFPGGLSSPGDWAWLIGGGAWVALVSAGLFRAGRIRWAEKARHLAIWAGIVGVLVLGLTYRDEFADVGRRVRGEFSSTYPVAAGAHELVVSQDQNGGFFIMGQVNGQPVRFLVDTGASDTVLSPADARRLGVDTAVLQFDRPAETANGVGYGAAFTADSLAVGSIRFADFPMLVNQSPMTSSLLGMSFLKRLESFQVRGRKLYLKSRD
ncbi:MAG: putative aspartyl protease [Phenylobacterium sp.]|nr:putative aspartyl protease [Phenylobacterium sp.]